MVPRVTHYRIEEKIGKGGMGEVYLAEDTRLGRKVAIKLLPAEFAKDLDRMRRFQQEARAASALNHPNILTIYEIDSEDDIFFMATEFIEGETLRQRLTGPPMKLAEILDVMIQAASALVAAHAAGIVHRDIKPANIMVRPDGYVKVLDFGLAKLTERASSVLNRHAPTALLETNPGIVMGTVGYMSPEQARGLPVDARTDIFSLGVLLYEMITGQSPFEGETTSDVVASTLQREPLPLARFCREVPEALQWIVTKALRKDREERYQTAKELLTDLRSLKQRVELEAELERLPQLVSGAAATPRSSAKAIGEVVRDLALPSGHQVVIRPQSSAEYIVTEIKRHKARLGLVLVALVVLALGLSRFLLHSGPINSVAVLPFENLSGDPNQEFFADGMTEALIAELGKIGALKVISRTSVMQYKQVHKPLPEIGRELKVGAIVESSVMRSGDQVQITAKLFEAEAERPMWSEVYQKDLSNILTLQREVARDIARKIQIAVTPEEEARLTRTRSVNSQAHEAYLLGRFHWNKLTDEGVQKAIDNYHRAIRFDPNYALPYTGLAISYSVLGNAYMPPNEVMPQAKRYATKAIELDDTLAEAHYVMTVIKYFYDWDWPGTERELKRTLELNSSHADALVMSSHLLQTKGRPEEAIAESKRALEYDPLSLLVNINLAYAYYFAGQNDRAIGQCRKAIELEPNFFFSYMVMAWAYEQKRMYDDAIAQLTKARPLSGENPALLASLARAYARTGDGGQARKIIEDLTQTPQPVYVSPYDIATIYASLGQPDQALAWLNKAYEEKASWMPVLKIDPRFAHLRSHPDFQSLLRLMRLDQ